MSSDWLLMLLLLLYLFLVSKWWHNFHFGVNYSLNSNQLYVLLLNKEWVIHSIILRSFIKTYITKDNVDE